MRNKLKRIFCFEFFVVSIYMIFTFITLMLHEPWFDEAQSWMIAKELDVLGIISQMKFEGHSALWSLILHLFVKLGFNYNIQNIFVWFLSVLGVIFFMYKVNISKLIKVPFLFTIGSIYYCSVFARPYVLIFLIFLLLLYYYDKRYEHPFIVSILLLILSNAHLMVMGFLGALFLIELYGLIKKKDNVKERIIFMSFMVLGVLIFFLQVVGSIFSRPDIVNTKDMFEYIYTFMNTIREFFYSHSSLTSLMFLSFIFILMIIVYIYKENKENFFIFICSSLFFVMLSTFIYYLNEFKYFYIVLVLLFCCRNLFNNKYLLYLFSLFLICGIYSGVKESLLDWNNIYSIELNIYEDVFKNKDESRILSFGEATVLSLYCDECKIYNINVDKFVSYNPYVNDLTIEGINYENIIRVINSEDMDYILMRKTYYTNDFLSNVIDKLEQEGIMELTYVYQNGIFSDDYYLFTIDKK